MSDKWYISGPLAIGTPEPAGQLTLEGIVQPGQGRLTFFSNSADMEYDGGSDGIFLFSNTTPNGQTAFVGGNVGIGTTDPKANLSVSGAHSTTQIETAGVLHLLRPGVPTIKNSNSIGLSVGAFEEGIAGKTRLDIKLSGNPQDSNQWGSIPDVTVMTLRADGNVGIGTADPRKGRLVVDGGKLAVNPKSLTTWPAGWGDGIHTWDLYGEGTVGAGNDGKVNAYLSRDGHGYFSGNVGIGTTTPNPNARLHLKSSALTTIIKLDNEEGLGVSSHNVELACGPYGLNFNSTGSITHTVGDRATGERNKTMLVVHTAGITVNASLLVNGTKSFVQTNPANPNQEIVYVSLEGGEAGTFFRGSGNLDNGKAIISLPEHFALVSNDEGLTVQLTPKGKWLQLYTSQIDTKQIVVHEAQGKNGDFDYLIQGTRKGYENHQVIREKK